MNILLVSQFFWPENFRVNDLCSALVEKGHQVTVLTGIPNYPKGRFFPGYGLFKNRRQNYRGAAIIRVPLFPRFKSTRLSLILNYFSFALSASILIPFSCRGKYDVIFVWAGSPVLMALPALFLSKLKRIPLVLYVLDLWPEVIFAVGAFKSPFVLGQVGKIVRFIYKHCDQILVPSPGFIQQIEKMGVDQSRIAYWPQWAENTYRMVGPEKNLPESRSLPNGFRVMFAGNIGAAQGFETIMEAAKKLRDFPEIKWVILGDGRMKSWVQEQVELYKLQDAVYLLGSRPVEEMSNFFAQADLLLVSLRSDFIFSLFLPAKIQSYMACGRPIIACLNGVGAKLVQESGAGFSCPAGDYLSLAESVLKMFKLTDGERKIMGLNGRAYFEKHFTRDIVLAELENRFRNLIRG